MSLQAFFAAARPFLEGRSDVTAFRRVGATPSPDADLAMYPWLMAWDQDRVLAELMPTVKTWVEGAGLDWSTLVRAYVRAHPPTGFSVPHTGAQLADFLGAYRADQPDLPEGIEALADFTWTAFLARTAPDEGPDLDRRVFVRHYTHDPRAANRALLDGTLPGPLQPVTLVVFRDEAGGGARTLVASLATVAVLLEHAGLPRAGALALPPEQLALERNRLERRGVLPQRAPSGAGEEA